MFERFTQASRDIAEMVSANAPRGKRYQKAMERLEGGGLRAQPLNAAGEAAAALGLTPPHTGELSALDDDDLITITRQWADLARLTGRDLLALPLSFETAPEDAPPHLNWHRAIYEAVPAGGVLLCQPVYATALAGLARPIDFRAWAADVVNAVGGCTVLAAPINEEHLADAAISQAALLLPGVGLLTWGESTGQAVTRAALAEHLCRIVHAGLLLQK